RGDVYIYYDIHPDELRVVDVVVEENLRRKGFGTVLVRLVEDRARLYGVGSISGASTREGKAFWRHLGYTVDNAHMEKRL
ncbi:MAG: GNAT family N-acetyltransferase, partial [Chloroflexota bacterium]|nr:GNAT family N-acetyltransferase [Chloroflexota bacterium]